MREALWQFEHSEAVANPMPCGESKSTLETPSTVFFLLSTLPVIAVADSSKEQNRGLSL